MLSFSKSRKPWCHCKYFMKSVVEILDFGEKGLLESGQRRRFGSKRCKVGFLGWQHYSFFCPRCRRRLVIWTT